MKCLQAIDVLHCSGPSYKLEQDTALVVPLYRWPRTVSNMSSGLLNTLAEENHDVLVFRTSDASHC